MTRSGRWSYRDSGALAAWTQRLLWAQAALSLAAMLFVWMRGFEAKQAGLAEAALLAVQLVLFVAAGIATLRWIYVANANAHALGAADMMVSPGWAVGWFFVPLMNLVMPYLAMRELWKASARPRDWQMEAAPAAILAWWLLWLASGIAAMIGFRLSLEPEAPGSGAEISNFVSDLAFIPSLLLLAWIVGRIQAMQSRGLPTAVFA